MAILMLFIAPEISRSLQQHSLHNLSSEQSPAAMPAMADMPGMMPDMPQKNTGKTAPSGITDNAACGYCVLLLHMPLLLAVALLTAWLSRLLPPPPVCRSHRILPAILFAGDLQPRAPPCR